MANSLVDLSKKIIYLTEQERLIINDFEQRYGRFLLHKQAGYDLLEKTRTLIKAPSTELQKEIEEIAQTIEINIVSSLRYMKGEDLEESKLLQEEEDADKTALAILETDILEIRANIGTLSQGKVKEALLLFVKELREETEELKREQKINKYLESLLLGLAKIIPEEQRLLEGELSILNEYKFPIEEIDEVKKARLSATNTSLKNIFESLEALLIQEKSEFIEPYKVFTNRKYTVTKKILERSKEKCITLEMLKKDLKELTPLQAEEYLEKLLPHFQKFEEPALQFFLRFKNFFRRKSKTLQQKAEDELNAELALLERKANYDRTTGLSNKEFFEEAMTSKIKHMGRIGGTLAIFIMDLDNFKSINDTYGHPVGDKVLFAVAQTAKESLRAGDIICRWGGEEFVVIFSSPITSEGAEDAAGRIRLAIFRKVRERILSDPDTILETLKNDLNERKITISGGVAVVNIPPMQVTEEIINKIKSSLLEVADGKLYDAKKSGKNKVEVASVKFVLEGRVA